MLMRFDPFRVVAITVSVSVARPEQEQGVGGLMRANVGDRIVIKGHHVGEPDRDAEILEVHGEGGVPPYVAGGAMTATKAFSSRGRTRASNTSTAANGRIGVLARRPWTPNCTSCTRGMPGTARRAPCGSSRPPHRRRARHCSGQLPPNRSAWSHLDRIANPVRRRHRTLLGSRIPDRPRRRRHANRVVRAGPRHLHHLDPEGANSTVGSTPNPGSPTATPG